ncbi:hypothetical protein A9Q84_11010 [Halobacteriovorax marinus]|uniref:Glutaredoxin 2 C-terminal domain-containing protein n=1 Tax=Halobacteriovorax marinus TaxID=97084 RepID=A0A1Y5FD25_9BACT|nr:hypothetical protein A9Q84_11010 [Halobacteriovorax marinus]
MAFNYLNLPFESIVLPYDDEATPIKLMGKKMLPIVEFADGSLSNESLDIIKKMDSANTLSFNLLTEERLTQVNELLSKIGKDVHCLCMPYWMWTPEFNEKSRKYFQTKKEVKRGPFNKLILDKETYLKGLEVTLSALESKITTFYESEEISIIDIMIASHLWGMFIFPEFQFSNKIFDYLQRIKKECNFEYHIDFWKD